MIFNRTKLLKKKNVNRVIKKHVSSKENFFFPEKDQIFSLANFGLQ